MLRNIFLILFIVLGITSLHAQTVFNGRVLENKTRIALHGVQIENLATKLKSITGTDGRFSIAAKSGDILVFKVFAYKADTLLITDLHDKEIFMEPQVNMLNQVTITDTNGHISNANKNSILPYDPQFHGQTAVYHRDKEENFDGGVNLRIHYFTKDDNDKKKTAAKMQDIKISEHISSVFTAENISQFVPLKGEDMTNFLLLYTPDVKTYTKDDFNFLSYLSTCYKAWQKLTPDEQKAGQIFKKQ